MNDGVEAGKDSPDFVRVLEVDDRRREIDRPPGKGDEVVVVAESAEEDSTNGAVGTGEADALLCHGGSLLAQADKGQPPEVRVGLTFDAVTALR